MEHLKNKVLEGQTREVIANVIRICDEESANNAFKLPLKNKTERAAMYCGVGRSTIAKIRKEDQDRQKFNPTEPLSTPGKKRKRLSVQEKIDNADFGVIRRIIEKFYTEYKVIPTLGKMLAKIKEEMEFPYERDSLRRLLKHNGFYWRRCQNRRKILMEKPNILHLRYKFLRSIKQYRSEGKNIIYLDETWVDTNLSFKKCWQSENVFGVAENISSSGRYIVVHAGNENGFVQGAALIFKAGLSTGDYHGQMNELNFTKWIEEKLLPNIPKQTVVVMDNAPYHSVLASKVPTKSSTKGAMVKWLKDNKIQFDESKRKFELYDVVCAHKPNAENKNYKIDNLLREHGHIPLRTPPYMCELNPIELVWAEVKRFIRNHNTGDLTSTKLLELLHKGIESVSTNHWKNNVRHVIDIENKYWETDQIMEEITERLIIKVDDDESDTDSDDFDDSEEENIDSDKETN